MSWICARRQMSAVVRDTSVGWVSYWYSRVLDRNKQGCLTIYRPYDRLTSRIVQRIRLILEDIQRSWWRSPTVESEWAALEPCTATDRIFSFQGSIASSSRAFHQAGHGFQNTRGTSITNAGQKRQPYGERMAGNDNLEMGQLPMFRRYEAISHNLHRQCIGQPRLGYSHQCEEQLAILITHKVLENLLQSITHNR